MNKSILLDQYFTKRPIASKLYEITVEFLKTSLIEFDYWLEPAAGDGAFYNLLPVGMRIGFDIDARIPEIYEMDFLTTPISWWDGRCIAIGNPPFGKNSKLAIDFFNHCACFCVAIAFIVPKTFFKDSVINKLDQNFHFEFYHDLPDNSFEIDGLDKNVPCVFQIWVRKPEKRGIIELIRSHPDLEFLPPERLSEASVLFQRVGAGAGTFKSPNIKTGNSPKSNYYIRCSDDVLKILLSMQNWETKYWTAGNPSISKSDLIEAYIRCKDVQIDPS